MSVDKNVVAVAEQVGLFLAPTLRAIVGSLFAESVGGLLTKVAEVQASIENMRANGERRSADMERLTEELRELRASQAEQSAAYEKAIQKFATAESQAELRRSVDATIEAQDTLQSTVERLAGDTAATSLRLAETCRELSTASTQQRVTLESLAQDIAGVRDLALQGDDFLQLKTIEQIAAVKTSVDLIERSVQYMETTGPKIRSEISAEISTAVAGALKDIKLPEPVDVQNLIGECRDAAASVVAESLPKVQGLVSAGVEEFRTELLKAVDEIVQNIEVPQPQVPDISGVVAECRAAAATVTTALPALEAALADSVRDEVSRAVAALPKPKDGEPGPAGLMGAVEPYIEGCVYERLALVSHAGGTWQATQRTKAAPAPNLGAWQAIAAGVSGVSVHADADLRTVEVSTTLTDGTVARHLARIPTMIYRDVYSSESAYAPADVVTYAGSMWLALKETTGEQPSKSPEAWRLVVKRGQEGRDGKDGAHGVQFQAGFEGEYEENKAYAKNSIVSYASSLWMSKRPTKERPPYMSNVDNEHWLRLR